MRPMLALFALAALFLPAPPARADTIGTAFSDAITLFERALPQLGQTSAGVEVTAYRQALTVGHFRSRHWGEAVTVDLHESLEGSGACSRFAAFVSLPPQQGTIRLTICPQFSAQGTPALRRLTVLHEMVHVVAGPDECRAMAFAARIEHLATGAFTPVDAYWQANGCAGSGFRLP